MARFAIGTEVRAHVTQGVMRSSLRGHIEKLGHGWVTIRDTVGHKYSYPLVRVVLEKLSASCHCSNLIHGLK